MIEKVMGGVSQRHHVYDDIGLPDATIQALNANGIVKVFSRMAGCVDPNRVTPKDFSNRAICWPM